MISDDFHTAYICVRQESSYYMMGPLGMQVMGRAKRHRFYHFYGIDEKWEKSLHYHILMEILQIAGMFAKIITGEEYTDQQLVDANCRAMASEEERKEQAKRVREQKDKRHTSSYLSRLFKKETGTSLQDFINDVRVEKAANLLVYSEETLPGIAEYVNFPTQSYFGKIFKQKMQMTPRQYRELHKPAEFYGKTEGQSGDVFKRH